MEHIFTGPLLVKRRRREITVLCIMLLLIAALCAAAEETEDYVHYRLGVKFKNENNFDPALEEFRKVLTAYPDNYNAYMQIAEIRKSQNQPRLEIFNLKKALACNPGWGKAHKMLAEAYETDKQFQNAIMELQMYQQSCDPAEQESVQKKIDQMLKRAKGRISETAADSVPQSAQKDSTPVKAAPDSAGEAKKKAAAPPAIITRKTGKTQTPASTQRQGGAEDLLKKAVALYEQGKYEAALPYVKKSLALYPRDPEAFFYGGLLRYKMGNYSLAKVNFSKSFAYPSASVDAHFYLGKIFGVEKYYRGAVEELTAYVAKAPDSDQRKEAVTLLTEYKKRINDTTAIAPAPPSAAQAQSQPSVPPVPERVSAPPESAYTVSEMRIDSLLTMQVVDTLTNPGQAMLQAVREFKAGKFDDAIKAFKKIMVAYPASAVAAPCMYNIGVCYVKLRLFPNADNQFDNIRNRFPSHPLSAQALFLKSLSLYERGDMSHCERLLREFIQKYRSNAWTGKAWEKLGDVYVELKDLTKAMDAYRLAAAQSKEASDQLYANFKLANAAFDAGNPERAVAVLKKLIETGESRKIFVRVPDAYFKLADYAYQRKDYKNALEYYLRVVRKFPGYQETPWGLFQVGNAFKNLKNYPKAIDAYKELMADHPDDYWSKQARWKMDDAVWENEYKTVLQ